MGNINSGYLSGRIYSLRTFGTGSDKVANISLRQYHKFKSRSTGEDVERVDFFPLEAWGPLAEYIERVFTKGLFVSISYELKVKKDKDTNHDMLVARIVTFDPQPVARDEQAESDAEE